MYLSQREQQIDSLRKRQELCSTQAQMVLLVGRSGIGKTAVALEATKHTPTLYFLATRKAEALLCKEYIKEIKRVLGIEIDEEISSFRNILKQLIIASETKRFNLIIDNIQELCFVNQKIFEDIQSIWHRNVERSKLFLLLVGNELKALRNVYSGNNAILSECIDMTISLKDYTIQEFKNVLSEYHTHYSPDELLAIYTFTGGVPKYLHYLLQHNVYTAKDIVDLVVQPFSPFLMLGQHSLIENIGKEYTFYFSILICIAQNLTARTVIEDAVKKEIGGYLTRMENDFSLITKQVPLFSKTASKNLRYTMPDNYLKFWFRYAYDKTYLQAQGDYEALKTIILSDYTETSQVALCQYFTKKYAELGEYDTVGAWWNFNETERIDLIALNETDKTAIVALVRLQEEESTKEQLLQTATALTEQLEEYTVEYKILTPKDM